MFELKFSTFLFILNSMSFLNLAQISVPLCKMNACSPFIFCCQNGSNENEFLMIRFFVTLIFNSLKLITGSTENSADE